MIDRRHFVTGVSALSYSSVMGANERVRAGVIGAGGRGKLLTGEFKEIGVEMSAVCDVYEPNLASGLKVASTGAKGYDNYKRLLEDKSLDVVVVATPDHWHAQMTIDAVETGKDVYVEKPMAHTIEDGYRMIAATRRTKRVVQVGMQRRSFDLFHEGSQLMRQSDIGEIRLVNAWWYNHQAGLRTNKLEGKLDWKQWLGAAPTREADPTRFFNWYYYWDYSGGLMIGQAAHAVDSIQWFMGSKEPVAVTTSAGRANLAPAEVPETTCMCIEYPENYMAIFTVGYKAMRYSGMLDQLTQYHGSKARFDMGRESYALYREDPKATELKASATKQMPGAFNGAVRSHIRNFLECVKSRKDPNGTVDLGQQTNITLCMAMKSLQKQRRIRWNAAAKRMEA